MNETVSRLIELCHENPSFGLIHSAGKRGYAAMVDRLRSSAPGYEARGLDVREFIYDMPRVMAAADVIMCRAGASTLAELEAMGKPAVLVPSPNVTNNHQEKNARVFEAAGAAKVLTEGSFTAETLLDTVTGLLKDRDTLDEMASAMASMCAGDATEKIAEIVLELCGQRA